LPEYVGFSASFSASTRKVDEKHTNQTSNYEVDHERKRNLIKIKL
jgi:hypothetical protein